MMPSAYFFADLPPQLMPLMWIGLGILVALGLLAVISPTRFSALASRSGQWVDSEKYLRVLDKRIDVDQYVLPYSRWLGVAVLFAVGLLVAVWR
jgi:hypothetical protein